MNWKKLHLPVWLAALVFVFAMLFVCDVLTASHLSYFFDFVGYGGTFAFHEAGRLLYWGLMLLGLGISLVLSLARKKAYDLPLWAALVLPVAFLAVAFAGGKLLYLLENWDSVLRYGLGWDGISLFGAVFLVPAVAAVVGRFGPVPMGKLLDFCAPFGLVLLACVRMGCFFQGCCGGVTFWLSNNTPLILPVQLMEVVLDLLLLELCFALESRHPQEGWMYPTFLMGYGGLRFVLEFFRDTPKEWLFLSNGQIFALAALLLGGLLFSHFHKKAARKTGSAKGRKKQKKASRTGQKS